VVSTSPTDVIPVSHLYLMIRPGNFYLHNRVRITTQEDPGTTTHVITPHENLDPGLNDLLLYNADVQRRHVNVRCHGEGEFEEFPSCVSLFIVHGRLIEAWLICVLHFQGSHRVSTLCGIHSSFRSLMRTFFSSPAAWSPLWYPASAYHLEKLRIKGLSYIGTMIISALTSGTLLTKN